MSPSITLIFFLPFPSMSMIGAWCLPISQAETIQAHIFHRKNSPFHGFILNTCLYCNRQAFCALRGYRFLIVDFYQGLVFIEDS